MRVFSCLCVLGVLVVHSSVDYFASDRPVTQSNVIFTSSPVLIPRISPGGSMPKLVILTVVLPLVFNVLSSRFIVTGNDTLFVTPERLSSPLLSKLNGPLADLGLSFNVNSVRRYSIFGNFAWFIA